MMKKFAFGLIMAINAASLPALAASDIQAPPMASRYLHDTRGIISRTPYGLCWRTGDWTPADAVLGCDGELAPPIVKATAPEIAPPTPLVAATPIAELAPQRCDFSLTLDSDEAFFFNSAALNPPAKIRLDAEVLGKLNDCSTIERIAIVGHTDRMGSSQYNQKLSEKRANAVAAYLHGKNISATIAPSGAGHTQPIKICSNSLPRPQLIACLAPNRRVAIEVAGTKN